MIIWHNHHIVPKHMGGTDAPDNLIRVNIAMHAFLHKCLFEEYGCWQDEVAWKALSGQITVAEASLEANRRYDRSGKNNPMYGKPGVWLGKKRPDQSKKMRNQEYRRQKYEITFPDGKKEIITGLVDFCKQYKINASNLCQVAKGKKPHANGFRCKKVEE